MPPVRCLLFSIAGLLLAGMGAMYLGIWIVRGRLEGPAGVAGEVVAPYALVAGLAGGAVGWAVGRRTARPKV